MINDYPKAINEQDNLHLKIEMSDGEPMDFRRIYHENFDKVFHFVSLFLVRKEEMEEVVKQIFLGVWEKRERIKSYKNISTFLFTIVKNKVLDKIKKYALVKTQND